MVRLCLLAPKALPPQGQAGSWVPQDYCLLCLLVLSLPASPRLAPMGRLPSWELGLLGQGECVGSLKEQTHGLSDARAGPGGSLVIGSQSQGLWSKMDSAGCGARAKDSVPLARHKQTKPVPDGAREQRLTAECLAGTKPWCYGNFSLAAIVLATWDVPGAWGWVSLSWGICLAWPGGMMGGCLGLVTWARFSCLPSLSSSQLCPGLLGPACYTFPLPDSAERPGAMVCAFPSCAPHC